MPFREAAIRIGGDGFLQDFLRMRKKAVMDFTFLDKCFLAIRPETWRRVNERLGRYGAGQGAVIPKAIRTGFCPEKSKFEELAKLMANLAIPQRMQDFMDKLLASCQAFRAGIEGTKRRKSE